MPTTSASFELSGRRVWVAGHQGMVGAALVRRLASENCEILTATRAELDLRRQSKVEEWMAEKKPDAILLAAGKVGGIHANSTYPAEFIYDNIALEANIIHAAHVMGVRKMLFLGSSCIYPREAPQPMREEYMLSSAMEPTNEWYAIAKIAGIKMCQAYRKQYGDDFISAMPTNLYGPGDNFHPLNSHVPAALMRRFHEAKEQGVPEVAIWGSGTPRREFLHVDDLADACIFLLKNYSDDMFVNIGTGKEISIADFAKLMMETVGYHGKLVLDTSKPDGPPRKLLDVSRLAGLGWTARTGLPEGLASAYRWYLDARASGKLHERASTIAAAE